MSRGDRKKRADKISLKRAVRHEIAHRFAWQYEQAEQDTDEAYDRYGESVCASDQKYSNKEVR